MLDPTLFVLFGGLTVLMTVLGVVWSVEHPVRRRAFSVLGLVTFGLIVWQGVRTGQATQRATSEAREMQKKLDRAASEAQGARDEVVKERADAERERIEATQARKDQRAAVAALQSLINQRARETERSLQGTVGKLASDTNTALGQILLPPRSLNSEQRKKLVKALKEAPAASVSVYGAPSSPEAQRFADQLGEAIGEAGWQVKKIEPIVLREAEGIWIFVRDVEHPPSGAVPLQQALRSIGVLADGVSLTSLEADTIQLTVGLQPKAAAAK